MPELPRSPLRRSLSVLLAALCVLAFVPAAAQAGTLDQSQPDTDSSASLGGTFRWAQTFTAGISGELDQVDLLLARGGDPGDLTVEVRTVSGGVPSSPVLASETVAPASVPTGTPGWVSVALSPPAPSSAGTQFAIVLSAPSGGFPDLYGWAAKTLTGDPYPAGQLLVSSNGGATWGGQPGDFAFKTYVATRPPVAVDDAYATSEDTQLTVAAPGVLSNDSDPDGNPLTASVVSEPSHGTLTLSAGGSFTYTPAADFNGSDSFTYRAQDGSLSSGPATVAITVAAVDDPAPPATPPATPPASGAPAEPALAGLRPASRCVRRSRSGRVRVRMNMQMARPAPLQIRIARAVDARHKIVRRCPKADPRRPYQGRFRPVRTVPEASTRPAAAAAAVARRLTLELRLAPGMYRIAVRARLDAGGLSPPALVFVRVLGPDPPRASR